jgi:hypothetical protein
MTGKVKILGIVGGFVLTVVAGVLVQFFNDRLGLGNPSAAPGAAASEAKKDAKEAKTSEEKAKSDEKAAAGEDRRTPARRTSGAIRELEDERGSASGEECHKDK